MDNRDNRGDFYNTAPPQADPDQLGRSAHMGLDFEGEERVNPEDLSGGNPTMTQQSIGIVNPDAPVNSLDGLERLLAAPPSAASEDGVVAVAQAVLYLRVSTPRQLHTAADIDEDGNSIATQRVEALRKVRELRATVAHEFIEPGQSAQTISKRTEFKRLLRYIDEHPDVKYVVIYMRSRVFRNFTDAAITKRELLQKGVRLISAKEEFGEGYMADAMEAITDIMNEVQVRMSGEDVKVKMAHKVEQGGSVGRAKLGYLNVRKDFSGRLVNTIDVDPDRAPLVTWAFEQYATGRYSIARLQRLLEAQGLATRSSPSQAAKTVSTSRLALILRDPYYTGVIRYKDKLYVGRHEALVSKETFLKVQDVLDMRKRHGSRDIVHFHYLKGMLFCGECRDAGRTSRLLYSRNTGNGGVYEYLICAAHQRRLCSTPGARVDQLEAEIVPVIAAERIATDDLEKMQEAVTKSVDNILAQDRDAKTQLRKQLNKLEAQEERLIELAATGALPMSKIRERIEKTALQRSAIEEKLEFTAERLRYSADAALAFLQLLADPGRLYSGASDAVRRNLLSAFFTRLVVYVTEDGIRVESVRNDTNNSLRELNGRLRLARENHESEKTKTPRKSARSSVSTGSRTGSLDHGLSNYDLAGVPGLEPRTTESESAVLPITPYPKGVPTEVVPRIESIPRRTTGQTGPNPGGSPVHEPGEAPQGRVFAEELQRLEQRRRDPSTADGDPQRPVRDPGLQAESVDQRGDERFLDRGCRELRRRKLLEGGHGGHDHLVRVRGQRGDRIVVVRHGTREEEAEEARGIAQKGQSFLDEGCGRTQESCLLPRRRRIDDPRALEVGDDAFREDLGRQHPDVVPVDGLGLLLVEAGGVRVHVPDVECRRELLEGEHVAVRRDGPPEKGKVVQQAFGDETPLALKEEIGLRVALGELFVPGVAQDEGHVGETRDEGGHTGLDEGSVERELTRGGRHEILAADDVGDPHQRVVDGVDEGIEGNTARADQDEVREGSRREGHLAADEIDVSEVFVRHTQAPGRLAPLRAVRGALLLGQIPVEIVVAQLLRSAVRLVARVDLFRRRVALVHRTRIHELLQHLAVDLVALRLPIGRVRPPDLDTLVPVDVQPAQGFEELLVALLAVTGGVGVLDPEHELPTVVAGVGPVEEHGADETHVREARRRRAESHADIGSGGGGGSGIG